jgi:hypothetical protein
MYRSVPLLTDDYGHSRDPYLPSYFPETLGAPRTFFTACRCSQPAFSLDGRRKGFRMMMGTRRMDIHDTETWINITIPRGSTPIGFGSGYISPPQGPWPMLLPIGFVPEPRPFEPLLAVRFRRVQLHIGSVTGSPLRSNPSEFLTYLVKGPLYLHDK